MEQKDILKYENILVFGRENTSNHLYLVNQTGERHFEVSGKVGYPFFGEFILDCLNGTENAMTQEHAFRVAELCIEAQEKAINIKSAKTYHSIG